MSDKSNIKLVIIAGEVSGDLHGARLISALKKSDPEIEIYGIGGDLMIEQGLRPSFHIRDMAFLGIGEVLRHLPFIKKVFRKMYDLVDSERPAAVILIDYPGFNLRFAGRIHKLGIPVVYFISPQLWAWGKRRVFKVKKYVKKMLVIFPFEKSFYEDYSVDADYVGHPLADRYFQDVQPKKSERGEKVLGLLPGSRMQELEKLLPDMIGAADLLLSEGEIARAEVLKVQTIPDKIYQNYMGPDSRIQLVESPAAPYFNRLDAALVSSGTATLETAYFQVPLVIAYRVSLLTWILGNLFVKIKLIGLANIVAGKQIAVEMLQHNFSAEKAAGEIKKLLEPGENAQKREQLKVVREKLGEPGASERAAGIILGLIHEKRTLP